MLRRGAALCWVLDGARRNARGRDCRTVQKAKVVPAQSVAHFARQRRIGHYWCTTKICGCSGVYFEDEEIVHALVTIEIWPLKDAVASMQHSMGLSRQHQKKQVQMQ